MQIESTLTEKQVEELFAEHAILVRTMTKGEIAAVPIHKIIELFGISIGEWAETQIGVAHNGGTGMLSAETPQVKSPYTNNLITVVTRWGFRIIAAEHNNRKLCSIMAISEAARQWEAIWDARCARLDDVNKLHKSKARKGKQEASEQAAST